MLAHLVYKGLSSSLDSTAMTEPLSPSEREEIRKYFGKPVEELSRDEFIQLHRQLRSRYHPDNFEKFADETVREMATERF